MLRTRVPILSGRSRAGNHRRRLASVQIQLCGSGAQTLRGHPFHVACDLMSHTGPQHPALLSERPGPGMLVGKPCNCGDRSDYGCLDGPCSNVLPAARYSSFGPAGGIKSPVQSPPGRENVAPVHHSHPRSVRVQCPPPMAGARVPVGAFSRVRSITQSLHCGVRRNGRAPS